MSNRMSNRRQRRRGFSLIELLIVIAIILIIITIAVPKFSRAQMYMRETAAIGRSGPSTRCRCSISRSTASTPRR